LLGSDFGRLPAYSGATVPDSHRLPARKPWKQRHYAVQAKTPGLREGANMNPHALFAAILLAIAPPQQQLRIVALVPSLAEDLCAIGAGPLLVGVSVYSNDVRCARSVPVVGDFASVDTEKIIAQRANLVVAIPSQARLIEPLQHAGIRVIFMNDDSYANIFNDIQQLGALTGRQFSANTLAGRLHRETDAIRTRTKNFAYHPRVFVALGTGPIYTVGPHSYIATLIALAGGQNAVTYLPTAYAAYSAEALLRLQPDAIITDNAVGLPAVLGHEPWHSLRAVQNHHIFIIPNAALLERPGPRYNEGLQWLVDRLTPLARAGT
jgi:ABC-type Fe3+-hydroxamate transport system substrate-binding protein